MDKRLYMMTSKLVKKSKRVVIHAFLILLAREASGTGSHATRISKISGNFNEGEKEAEAEIANSLHS